MLQKTLILALLKVILLSFFVEMPTKVSAAPIWCNMSVINLQITNFDLLGESFMWQAWINALCDGFYDGSISDLVDVTFSESETGIVVNDMVNHNITVKHSEQVVKTYNVLSGKFLGRIPQSFDVRSFPYTENILSVEIEANDENSYVRWRLAEDPMMDHQGFICDKDFEYQGAAIFLDNIYYRIGFGVISTDLDRRTFDRIIVKYKVTQSDLQSFILAMLPTYIAVLMALLTPFIPVSEELDARLALLAGALFVVVLNIDPYSTKLGAQTYLTTGDWINMTAMIVIGIILIETVVEKILLMQGKAADIRNMCTCCNNVQAPKADADFYNPSIARKSKPLDLAFAPGVMTEAEAIKDPHVLLIPFWTSLGFWTFLFCVVAFFAVNIGLIAFYRA